MTSFGCFGSVLCYNGESDTCGNCPHHDECSAEIAQKRPQFILSISKYFTGTGETRAYKWLSKKEKAALREVRRIKLARLTSHQIYGDANFIDNLKKKANKNTHALIDKSLSWRVNLLTATAKQLSDFDKNVGFIYGQIEAWPKSNKDLIGLLEKFASLKEATAKRTTYTATALLEACDRIQSINGILEIK